MKVKHRIVEVITIVAMMALIVFLVKSCGKVTQAVSEPNESNRYFECGNCAESFGENENAIYSHVCKGYPTSRLIHQIEAIEARLDALEKRPYLQIQTGDEDGRIFLEEMLDLMCDDYVRNKLEELKILKGTKNKN